MGVWFQLGIFKVIFYAYQIYDRLGFQILDLKGAIEKCVGCFLVYLFQGLYFFQFYLKRDHGMGGSGFTMLLVLGSCIYQQSHQNKRLNTVLNIQTIGCYSFQGSYPIYHLILQKGCHGNLNDFHFQNTCTNILVYTALLYQNFYFKEKTFENTSTNAFFFPLLNFHRYKYFQYYNLNYVVNRLFWVRKYNNAPDV